MYMYMYVQESGVFRRYCPSRFKIAVFLVKGTGALCAGILVEPCFEGEAKSMLLKIPLDVMANAVE